MEDLTKKPILEKSSILLPTSNKIIVFQLSEPLLIKCRNFLTGKHLAHDYTHSNLSDLIRKCLTSYKEKKLALTINPLRGQPKKRVCLNLPTELWEFWNSLPVGHRANILESCLVNYLNNL